MILTQSFRATQPKDLLDSLNRESGRVYSQMVVTHWRIYRKKGLWLSPSAATRLNDYQTGATTLHAHSRDAAQQGFFKACKTTRSLRRAGFGDTRFPYKRKFFRTTVWKNTGLEIQEGILRLKRARGLEPIQVELPVHLHQVAIIEARLVYNRQAKAYDWHVVCEDRLEPPLAPGQRLVAVDMGEIHPAAASSDSEAVVFSARELRSTIQGRNKSLAEISALQSRCQRDSRRWKKLQQAKNRIRGKAKRKQRDICHKVSRGIVQFAKEQQAKKIIIGDVRDVADGVTIGKQNNQKISQWPHGMLRRYITYKGEREGIDSALQDEAYSSQTCPCCCHRHKPRGRIYICPKCGFSGSRDGQVGAPNILSAYQFGEPGHIVVQNIKYRHPYLTGKRSPVDTRHVAGLKPEAAGL